MEGQEINRYNVVVFQQGCPNHSVGKEVVFSTKGAKTIGYHVKESIWPLSHNIYKNQVKMDRKPKCKS